MQLCNTVMVTIVMSVRYDMQLFNTITVTIVMSVR